MSSSVSSKQAIGDGLFLLAEENTNFRVVVADVGSRIFANRISQKWPEKVIDVGISEQNMIGVAAALADEGYIVFAVSYSPFIVERCLDQVRVFLGIMRSNVKLIGFSAGFGGSDLGPTHTDFGDISSIKAISGIRLVSPCDYQMIKDSIIQIGRNIGPAYIRVAEISESDDYRKKWDEGKPMKCFGNRDDYVVLSNGTLLGNAIKAAKILAESKLSISVYDVPTIRPYNNSFFAGFAKTKMVFTIEEHNIIGGFGSSVLDVLNEMRVQCHVVSFGINDRFFYPDRRKSLLVSAGLDSQSLAESIRKEVVKWNAQ